MCTHIASLTDSRKVHGKDHWKTQNSVHKCQRICHSQQSSTPERPKGKCFPQVEIPWRSPCLAVKWLDRLHHHKVLLKVCHHVLPLLHYRWCPGTGFSLSHPLWNLHTHLHPLACNLKIATGLPWECYQILIYSSTFAIRSDDNRTAGKEMVTSITNVCELWVALQQCNVVYHCVASNLGECSCSRGGTAFLQINAYHYDCTEMSIVLVHKLVSIILSYNKSLSRPLTNVYMYAAMVTYIK